MIFLNHYELSKFQGHQGILLLKFFFQIPMTNRVTLKLLTVVVSNAPYDPLWALIKCLINLPIA